ncbi:MAG: hypothetical protein ACKOPO_06475 [Novosphingobium sp.]
MNFRTVAIAIALANAATPALAQNALPPHSVYGESDDETLTGCKVTHAAAIAHVESVLRASGIRTVTHTSETLSRDVILAYVNINALQVKQNGKPTGSCAYAVSYELYDNTRFINPVTKGEHFGKVMYCDRSGLLVWSAATAQAAVHKDLRTYVTECVTEYVSSKE